MLQKLKSSFREWSGDKAPLLAAALAYFSLFSLAPLLLIAISIAGIFFGEGATQQRIVGTIAGMTGEKGAAAVGEMLAGASQKKGQGIVGLVGGIVALLFGASGVFAHLKEILNAIWGVEEPPKKGILAKVLAKLWSVGMVLSVGFLLLVSLVLSSAMSAISEFMNRIVPLPEPIWYVIDVLVSFGVITLLFAAIFKFIPDAAIEWRDVWAGAAFTAILFVIGKFAIGFYLGRSAVASSYGAAGSVIVLLLWLYYSGLIVLFGGEFTEVWARDRAGITTREERRKRS